MFHYILHFPYIMHQAPVSELRKGTLRRTLLWGQAFTVLISKRLSLTFYSNFLGLGPYIAEDDRLGLLDFQE